MTYMETIIAVTFRLINFAIIVGFFVYLYKKYFYQILTDQINQKQTYIDGLIEKKVVLEEKNYELLVRIAEQEEKYKELYEKVMVWRQTVKRFHDKIEQEREASAVSHEKRVEQQERYLQQEKLKQIVIPQALIAAQEELYKKFTDRQAGHQFISQIVAQMKKRVS